MRYLLVACVAILSGCSKSPDLTVPATPSSPNVEIVDSSHADAVQDTDDSFLKSAKRDFALLFVAKVGDRCATGKDQQEVPDLATGRFINYAADGEISWGTNQFNYVEKFGSITFINAQSEHTFVFKTEAYDPDTHEIQFAASLEQLKGDILKASAVDSSNTLMGCVGESAPPAGVTQGAWSVAAKYALVADTIMSCAPLGKAELTDIAFSFNGSVIHAGQYAFTQDDSRNNEVFNILPDNEDAKLSYSVTKADGSSVLIALSGKNILSHAELKSSEGVQHLCTIK